MLRNPLVRRITEYAAGLRFPQLFLFTAALFVADLLIPDVVPFFDEILLGLATLFLAQRKRGSPDR